MCRRPAVVNSFSFVLTILFLMLPVIVYILDCNMRLGVAISGTSMSLLNLEKDKYTIIKGNSDGLYGLLLTFPFFGVLKFLGLCMTPLVSESLKGKGEKLIELGISQLKSEYDLILWLPLVSCFMYFVLAWYLMQVCGDSDSEFKKPMLFFLPSFSSKSNAALEGDRLAEMQVQSRSNHSFLIHKLSKSYNKGVTAVKEFCGEFTPGMCYVLLGPNGCGKTSLIKMISGVSAPSNGRAYLFGDSIRENVSKLFEVSASCYQEDILWNGLTVADHIKVFALFRDVPNACKSSVIDRMLDAVDLTYARNRRVANLSGGMKRRLCFLLSIIGTPEVLFLDEPTTGLDPVNRRKVWNLVQEHKKDKIVFL